MHAQPLRRAKDVALCLSLSLVFFSRTKRSMTLKVSMQHWVLENYQVCSNGDPELTLTYFTARSNLVPYAFVWEKDKTMDFSITIDIYDQLTSKLCPLGAVCPCPGAIYKY